MSTSYRFPEGFILGAATAAYQIEGAAALDGRKPSVWDTFSRTPGGTRNGETGDIANDHYHRYESDIALMASLGIKDYRFSIAWPRVLPDGTGAVNEKGVDFYRRLVDCLRKHGIRPHATLFHWDTPQALEDAYGGFRSRRIADDFADYCTAVVKRLGDRIDSWMTINEIPCFTMHGYVVGRRPIGLHAPGVVLSSQREIWQTVHHACLAHGKAVRAIRAASPRPCTIALVDNTGTPVPMTESAADIAAAKRAFQSTYGNGAIAWAVCKGGFAPDWEADRLADNSLPVVEPGDFDIISTPFDRVGLNIYSGFYVRAADNARGFEGVPFAEGYPRLDMPWLQIVPESVYWAARHWKETLGFAGDVVISENGCAAQDVLTPQGEVLDTDRVLYLRSYLRQVHRAVAEGYPVNGYFCWSFMDNFEWSWGYAKRFGLIYNIYETQQRIPKLSAQWYQECIKQHRVV